MKKFNYTKWVTDHKNGKPLFEQAMTGNFYCVDCSVTNCIGQTTGTSCNAYVGTSQPPNFISGPHLDQSTCQTACTGSAGTGSIQYYCSGSSCSTTPPPPWGPTGPNATAVYYDLQTCQNNCPPLPSGPPTASCHSQRWPNHSNWVSTWTNNNAFNSSNPNQPCNHICKKLTQWTNMGSGTIPLGPNQYNMVQCKLAEGKIQAEIHGCNC